MTYDQLIPRFLKYVKVETRSDETSSTTPSTQSQVAFLNDLAAELKGIGLTDVHVSQPSGYVFATLHLMLIKMCQRLVLFHTLIQPISMPKTSTHKL